MDKIVASTSTALSIIDTDIGEKRPKRRAEVLDEDEYLERLEHIVERDFFPHIKRLRAQNEYFDAVKSNDQAKIKQLQERFSSSRRTDKLLKTPKSPAFFETPQTAQTKPEESWSINDYNLKQKDKPENQDCSEKGEKESHEKQDPRVDQFLYKFTSEDNASFDEIMDENERRMRHKFAWMFQAEQEHKKRVQESLALRHADDQMLAIQASNDPARRQLRRASVGNWTYKAFNSVLFVPPGAEFTPDELVERQKMAERQILCENTRLPTTFGVADASLDAASKAAAAFRIAAYKGKVDAQGNEMAPSTSGQFAPVVTPSPMPGVGESPLMTWGEIEGTPFRLDASDTVIPRTPGPNFRIPDTPVRDKLALSMTADILKKNKEKKMAARQLLNITPKFGSARSTERLQSMSPAARRLATAKLGIRLGTDKALKASYTPSPARQTSGKTPVFDRSETPSRVIMREADNESLTDNLLKLPSSAKPKAMDFF